MKKAQSTIEYAILIAIVAGAFIAMRVYMMRATQANLQNIVSQVQNASLETGIDSVDTYLERLDTCLPLKQECLQEVRESESLQLGYCQNSYAYEDNDTSLFSCPSQTGCDGLQLTGCYMKCMTKCALDRMREREQARRNCKQNFRACLWDPDFVWPSTGGDEWIFY